jgi:hypothetical protein
MYRLNLSLNVNFLGLIWSPRWRGVTQNDEGAKEGAGSPWPDDLREEVGEFYMSSYHVDNLVLAVLPELATDDWVLTGFQWTV